jgi:hypothetical protein
MFAAFRLARLRFLPCFPLKDSGETDAGAPVRASVGVISTTGTKLACVYVAMTAHQHDRRAADLLREDCLVSDDGAPMPTVTGATGEPAPVPEGCAGAIGASLPGVCAGKEFPCGVSRVGPPGCA